MICPRSAPRAVDEHEKCDGLAAKWNFARGPNGTHSRKDRNTASNLTTTGSLYQADVVFRAEDGSAGLLMSAL
jgi:hypothetical protein